MSFQICGPSKMISKEKYIISEKGNCMCFKNMAYWYFVNNCRKIREM